MLLRPVDRTLQQQQSGGDIKIATDERPAMHPAMTDQMAGQGPAALKVIANGRDGYRTSPSTTPADANENLQYDETLIHKVGGVHAYDRSDRPFLLKVNCSTSKTRVRGGNRLHACSLCARLGATVHQCAS